MKGIVLLPLVLLVFYFIGCMLTIANYVAFVRYNGALYGVDLLRAYLAFAIIGTISYALFSGVAWLWAHKYCQTDRDRIQKIAVGVIIIFLFHDLPIFIMEWHMILSHGWRNPFQGFVYVCQWISFLLSFILSWLGYTYVASGYLHRSTSGYAGSALHTGQEQLAVLPPMSQREFAEKHLGAPLLPNANVHAGGGVQWRTPPYEVHQGRDTIPVDRRGLPALHFRDDDHDADAAADVPLVRGRSTEGLQWASEPQPYRQPSREKEYPQRHHGPGAVVVERQVWI